MERENYTDVGTIDVQDVGPMIPESWRLLDDVQLLELPDPEFLIEGVLPRRAVGVLYSPPGTGKTTLVAHTAVSLATGKPWFGHDVRHRGASIYVATEDPAGYKMRLRAAKRAAGLPLDTAIGAYTFPEPIDLRDPVSVNRFVVFAERAFDSADMTREVIFIDTYAAAMAGAAENSSEDTTIAMLHAQSWRDRLGCTVMMAHHTNASGSRERGHSAMRGAADFMIAMTPVDDVVHVECSKQRNAGPFETVTLKLTPLEDGGCVFRLASDVLPAVQLTPIQGKVYTVLRDTFAADGATKSEWQRSCQDINERSFYRACKVMTERGYVQQSGSHFRITAKRPQL